MTEIKISNDYIAKVYQKEDHWLAVCRIGYLEAIVSEKGKYTPEMEESIKTRIINAYLDLLKKYEKEILELEMNDGKGNKDK